MKNKNKFDFNDILIQPAKVSSIRLITDSAGTVIGSLFLPDFTLASTPSFTTGTKTFALTTSKVNSTISGTTDSVGETKYSALGTLQNVEETTLSKEAAKKAGKYAPRSGGSGTTKTPSYATYVSLKDAWDTGDTNELNTMNPDYTFVRDNTNNTIKVYKNIKDSNGKIVPEGMPVKGANGKTTPDKPFSTVKKARDIADLFYREGTKAEAQEKYDREQELWQGEFGDPSLYYSDGTPKKKPKAATPTTPKTNIASGGKVR
jgi:hypothetical protein